MSELEIKSNVVSDDSEAIVQKWKDEYERANLRADYWGNQALEARLELKEVKAERDDALGERNAYMKSYAECVTERDALLAQIAKLRECLAADRRDFLKANVFMERAGLHPFNLAIQDIDAALKELDSV